MTGPLACDTRHRMSKRNKTVESHGPLAVRTKKGTPVMLLADVLMAVVDHLATADFDDNDGELWNELKPIIEKVQRGKR